MLTDHPMNASAASAIRWNEFPETPTTTSVRRPRAFRRETLDLRIELGRGTIDRREADHLRTGAVVPLENSACEPVAVYADGELIAWGEAMDVDGKLGVRVMEVL